MLQRLTVLLAPGLERHPLHLGRRLLAVSTATAHTATTATERLLCLFTLFCRRLWVFLLCSVLYRRLASL